LVKPATVADVAPVVVALSPLGDAVTVYPVIAEPPLFAGVVQVTSAEAFAAVAVPMVGAFGAVATGVPAALAEDAGEVPATFAAVTVNV
jgi:hypothetical protein